MTEIPYGFVQRTNQFLERNCIRAKYGLLDRWIDVSQIVKQLFLNSEGDLIIPQYTNFNHLFGDAYPDLLKELIIEMPNGLTHVVGETEPATQSIIIKSTGPDGNPGPVHNFQLKSQFKPGPFRQIIDGFMIGNEMELLKIRLKYLDPVVDYFVIAESERTHQNQPKELILPKLLADPPDWLNVNKVIGVILTAAEIEARELATTRIEEHKGKKFVWGIENQQRESLCRGFEKLFVNGQITDLDLIVVSDLDEIPDRELLKYTRTSYTQRVLLRNFFHNYSFKWQKKDYWYGSIIFQYWDLRKKVIESLTHLRDFRYGYSRIRYIGGWHCSYFGGPAKVAEKLNNIVEGRVLYQDCQKLADDVSDDIKNKISTGVDLYGRTAEQLISNQDWTRLPQFACELEPELRDYLIDLSQYRRILIFDAVAKKGHVFKEIRESLLEVLSQRGYAVEITNTVTSDSKIIEDNFIFSFAKNSIHSPDIYLILGLHALPDESLPEHFIAYQLEQLPHSSLANEAYLAKLKRATRIWDYSQANILWLLERHIKAVYCPIGYSRCLEFERTLVDDSVTQANKIVFYGSLNTRRNKMIETLRMNSIPIEIYKNTCWGKDRIKLLSEAAMVINWHYFDDGLMELSRLAPLLSNRILVISEKAKEPEINFLLKEAVVLVNDLDELVTQVKYYIEHPSEAQIYADKGYHIFRQKFNFSKRLPLGLFANSSITPKIIEDTLSKAQTGLVIAFHSNQLSERGTEIALYDYANHNETILGNKSIIITLRNNRFHDRTAITYFQKRFPVFFYDDWNQVDQILAEQQASAIYMIKSGADDGRLSKICKNLIHCVFDVKSPHGDIYVPISPCVPGYRQNSVPQEELSDESLVGRRSPTGLSKGQTSSSRGTGPTGLSEDKLICPRDKSVPESDPWVPHMIDLPIETGNLRSSLGIPAEAIVFGRHGGSNTFNIKYVHQVIESVAQNRRSCVEGKPAIYFLFLNTDRFVQTIHPNIIFLPKTSDRRFIVKFINTCDAMIHARKEGETFGLSVAEFSTLNKPVITTNLGDQAHIHFLGDKKILYQNSDELQRILESFDPKEVSKRDWNAYRDFQPTTVMKQFEKIFLETCGVVSNKSLSSQSNEWKKTYVINLDRRPDRIEKFHQRFPELVNQYTRISATDGQRLSELIKEIPELAERINYIIDKSQNPFVIGCSFSHWQTWKIISQDASLGDHDFVLVFEDDVKKNDPDKFIPDLNQCLKAVKAYGEIDFLYIGGHPQKDFIPIKTIDDWRPLPTSSDRSSIKPIGSNLYIRPSYGRDTHEFNKPSYSRDSYEFDRGAYSYVITKAGARKFLSNSLDLFCFPIDYWMTAKLQILQMKVLELFPFLCTSPIDFDSDIINRDDRIPVNLFLVKKLNQKNSETNFSVSEAKKVIQIAYCDLWMETEGTPLTIEDMNEPGYYNKTQTSRKLLPIEQGIGLTYFPYLKELLKDSCICKLTTDISAADIVIASTFSNNKKAINPKAKLILLDYEPPRNLKLIENSNYCVLSSRPTTYVLPSRPTDRKGPTNDRFIYLPLFVHHWGFNLIDKLLNKPAMPPKTKFCLCIIKNQSCQFRNNYVKQLMNYRPIDCYGSLYKNQSNPIVESCSWTDPRLMDIIKDYKFMITFENCSAIGYHTEKIVMAMKSGTIPIYWGDPNINQIFNVGSFINVNELGVLNSIEKIRQLDQNDDMYNQMYREIWLSVESPLKTCSESEFKRLFDF